MTYQIRPERADDVPFIEPLLDRTFGADRTARTVYRLREGLAPVPELCFAAVDAYDRMLGSLRFWPITIAHAPAILFGPLAVEPALQGRGVGRALVRHGLHEAGLRGYRICVVVGEPEYYRPFGFINAPSRDLHLPGPVDPRRFQVAELEPGALEGISGQIGRADGLDPDRRTRSAAPA